MTKDRLKDLEKSTTWPHVTYQRVSQQAENHGVQKAVKDVGNHSGTIITENDREVMDILKEFDSIRSQIDKIDEFTKEVEQIQLDMLKSMPGPRMNIITDQRENIEFFIITDLKQKVDNKRNETETMAYKVSAKLNKLEQIQENQNDADKKTVQWRIRESQISMLTIRLRDTMNEYNRKFLVHRERCKQIIGGRLTIIGRLYNDDELEEMVENDFPVTLTHAVMADLQKLKEASGRLVERQRDIVKLTAPVKKLNDISVDLALLDAAKNDDKIEYNVSETIDFAGNTRYHDNIAVLKKSTLKNTIILSVILSAVAVVIIIIIFVGYVTKKKIK